jgi:hypothetical protein
VELGAVSGPTDWERHRLADPDQRLALEDPGFAARLGGSVRRSRLRSDESLVLGGRLPGAARLDAHRLARHLRGANYESAVQRPKTAGRG